MKKMFIIAAGALLAGATVSCGPERKGASASTETVRDVALTVSEKTLVPDVFEATGTVQAAQTVVMSAEMTGYVRSVRVREGDRVKRGETLVTIDDAQARAAVDQAQAALAMAVHESAAADSQASLAEVTLKRYQSLYEKKSVSPQEFDEVRTRLQEATARRELAASSRARAEAALQQVKTVASHAQVRAPFDGVVTARSAEPGMLAAPGLPLVTVESAGQYRLEATVNESDLKFVKRGQTAPVMIEAAGQTAIRGKVVEIVPAADASSRSFTIKIGLPASPVLRSGLFGRAQFSRGERKAVMVPQSAVLTRGQLNGVYVVGQDRVASLRYVTVGRAGRGVVEVLSGLDGGEQIAAAPGDRELGGKRIEVR